jgi:hypothetical protein
METMPITFFAFEHGQVTLTSTDCSGRTWITFLSYLESVGSALVSILLFNGDLSYHGPSRVGRVFAAVPGGQRRPRGQHAVTAGSSSCRGGILTE